MFHSTVKSLSIREVTWRNLVKSETPDDENERTLLPRMSHTAINRIATQQSMIAIIKELRDKGCTVIL